MTEPEVPIGERELERIGDYVRGNLRSWLGEVAPLTVSVPQLVERAVRVEEELKSQRELMHTRFDANDRRFEEMTAHSNQRFADMGTRFEDLTSHFDKRFEDLTTNVDKRFSSLQWTLGGVFVLLTTLMSVYQFVA